MDNSLELSIYKEKEDPIQTPVKVVEKVKENFKREFSSSRPFSIQGPIQLENYIIVKEFPNFQKYKENASLFHQIIFI